MKIINNLPFGSKTTVIDALNSNSSDFALSANQGRVLNENHEDLKQSIQWGNFANNGSTV